VREKAAPQTAAVGAAKNPAEAHDPEVTLATPVPLYFPDGHVRHTMQICILMALLPTEAGAELNQRTPVLRK
jgi:hypothetical protein